MKKSKSSPLKKVSGLVLFSMGIGMILVILVPAWSFLVAALLVVAGFWLLFI